MDMFTDGLSQTFYIVDDHACYVDGVRAIPKRKRKATKRECNLFEKRQAIIWVVVLDYYKYAAAICMRFKLDDQALSDVGVPAIMRAANTWDKDKGELKPHIAAFLRWAFIKERKRRNAEPKILFTDTPITHKDFAVHEAKEALLLLLEPLTQYERSVLLLYYSVGLTHQDIAERVGCGKSTIRRLVVDIIRRVRKRAWELGITTGRMESDWE